MENKRLFKMNTTFWLIAALFSFCFPALSDAGQLVKRCVDVLSSVKRTTPLIKFDLNEVKVPVAEFQLGKDSEAEKVLTAPLLKIGEGGNAIIFRSSSERQPVRTIKRYREHAKDQIEDDLAAIKYLKSIQYNIPFRVLDYSRIESESLLEVETVLGISVEKLFSYPSKGRTQIDLESVKNKYNQGIEMIFEYFEAVKGVKSLRKYSASHNLLELKVNLKNGIGLYLHADNIVIDAKTGDLVIIDPI